MSRSDVCGHPADVSPGLAADVRVARAESILFADATFDATLAPLVMNVMRDAEAGLREMAWVALGRVP